MPTAAAAVVAADGRRRAAAETTPRPDGELPPLLKKILQEYSATGLPPAYLPKTPPAPNGGPLMNPKKLLAL